MSRFAAGAGAALAMTAAACAGGGGFEQEPQAPNPNAIEIELPPDTQYGFAMGDGAQLEGETYEEWQVRVGSEVEQAAKLGAGVLRIEYDREKIETAPGVFDFSNVDYLEKVAEESGIEETVTLLNGSTAWDRRPECAEDWACLPTTTAGFSGFAAAVAERRVASGDTDGLYELPNERNINGFSQPGPDPAFETELYVDVRDAIEAYDPNAQVALGSLSPAGTEGGEYAPADFLAAQFAAGLENPDVINVHPYTDSHEPELQEPWNTFAQVEDLAMPDSSTIADVLEANGAGDTPIWFTEGGSAPTCGPEAVTPKEQATIAEQYLEHRFTEIDVDMRLLYRPRNTDGNPTEEQTCYGFLDEHGNPKYPPFTDALENLGQAA